LADITAIVSTIEVHLADSGVRVPDRRVKIGARGGDTKHATTRSLESVQADSRSGLKDFGSSVVRSFGVVEAVNRIAGANIAGITSRREDHTHRRVRVETEGRARKSSGRGAHEDIRQRRLRVQPVHQGLRFGIAETGVEFENLGAIGGQAG
jgi:hypothetical protein